MGNYGGKSFNAPRGGAVIRRRVDIPLESWKYGATPPTASSVGTTPAVRGLLFSSTSITATIQFVVPIDYAGGPIELHLTCVNTALEGNGDDMDWTLNYVTVTPISKLLDAVPFSSNLASKTSTQITSETEVFGSLAPPANNVWDCRFILAELETTNPLVYKRKAPTIFAGELVRGTHGGAGNVADILVIACYIEYIGKSDARIE